MIRITVNPNRIDSNIRSYSRVIDQSTLIKVDFSLVFTERSTTVSSVTWTSEGSQSLTISNEALSTPIATCDASGSYSGYGLIKCSATMADGNPETQYIKIELHDPEVRSA